jgi:rare lipoprotein A
MMALKARNMLFASTLAIFSTALVASANAQSGIASVYSGERTANGEYAHAGRLTAAHRSLPFGTLVRVTHKRTGRSVVVRINDRGPFVGGRIIDLTPAAARAIGFNGLAPVEVTVIGHS